MSSVQDKTKEMFKTLQGEFGYTSPMQAPKLEKVIVTTGIGKIQGDKKKVALIKDRLAKITGQKPKENAAKISVAGFKLREGNIIGYQVTLRGEMMYQFVNKLITIALPRTRDFRGLELNGLDEMGNYSFGIKENSVFPECSDEDINDLFGIGITFVTNSPTRPETEAFLRTIGLPLKKAVETDK